ncbi:hypothetical protein [Streptomyces sp. NPDC055299]
MTKTVDPLGNTTRTDYDEAGRVIARTDEINRTTRFDAIADAAGQTIQATYDAFGRVITATNSLGFTSRSSTVPRARSPGVSIPTVRSSHGFTTLKASSSSTATEPER